MEKIKNKILNYNTYAYMYIIMGFAYAIPYTKLIAQKTMKIFIIWSVLILINDLVTKKIIVKNKTASMLVIFVTTMSISIITNITKNFIPNIMVMIYAFTQIVMMFVNENKEEIYSRINIFGKIFSIIMLPLSLWSFWMFKNNFQASVNLGGVENAPVGTFEGRLWGVFGNPNALGAYSFISLSLSVINLFLICDKKVKVKFPKVEKIFYIVSIIVLILVGPLGNSRSALVGIIACIAAIYHSYKFDYYMDKKISFFKKAFKFISASVLIVIIILTMNTTFKQTSATISNIGNYCGNFMNSLLDIEKGEKNPPVKIEREYKDTEVSNGRLSIWNAALNVSIRNPLGVTQKSLNEEMNKFMPADILEKSKTVAGSVHNIYLQVLVAYGVIPFCIFIGIFINILIKYLKKLITINKEEKKYLILFGGLVTFFLTVNFFDSVMFETLSLPLCLSCWVVLGVFDCMLNSNKNNSVVKTTNNIRRK